MGSVPFYDFYHDHPYHQLNIGQEVEVVHEDLSKTFERATSPLAYDKSVLQDVITKGLPIPQQWLNSWKNVTVEELQQHVDLDAIFTSWHNLLPEFEPEKKVPNILSRNTQGRTLNGTLGATPIRKSILLAPSELPEMKREKLWEIQCKICGKILKGGNKRYEAHMKNSHEVQCICGEEFQCKLNLRTHIRKEKNKNLHGSVPSDVVTPQFECDFCDEVFRSLAIAEKHRQVVHGNQVIKVPRAAMYNCRSCKLQFKDRSALLNHYASKSCPGVQQRKFKYFCSICHKDYYCKKSCREHLKKVHDIHSRAEVFVKHIKDKQQAKPAETIWTEKYPNILNHQTNEFTTDELISNQFSVHGNPGTKDNAFPMHAKVGSVMYYSHFGSNTELN